MLRDLYTVNFNIICAMGYENIRTRNTLHEYICAPSTVEAALSFLANDLCLPDEIYQEAERNRGMDFIKLVDRLGGKVYPIVEVEEWLTAARDFARNKHDFKVLRKGLGSYQHLVSDEDLWWVQGQLPGIEGVSQWELVEGEWWVALQVATRMARRSKTFVALHYRTGPTHGHIELVSLGKPGESRSNDILIWNRDKNSWGPTFGNARIFPPQVARPGYGDLRRIILNDNAVVELKFYFFSLDPNHGSLTRRTREDSYLPERKPVSRL